MAYLMFYLFVSSLQLKKIRLDQLEKFYPNLICTQNLGLVRPFSKAVLLFGIFHQIYFCVNCSSKWTLKKNGIF